MREVKAYLRREVLETVLRALRDAGVSHVVVNDVHSFGSGVDPRHWRLSMDAGAQYSEHAKLEFVCADEDVDQRVATLRTKARTGAAGDGLILVSALERAVKIRTGAEGDEAIA